MARRRDRRSPRRRRPAEDPEAFKRAVLERLQGTMVEIARAAIIQPGEACGRLSMYGAGCVVESLEMAGFKIVRVKGAAP